MTKDAEAKEYVRQAQAGDQQAHEWLYERYKRFMYQQAREFSRVYPQLFDDFVGVAFVGYTKGVQTLDVAKDVQVLTYLSTCIQNEMRMYLRKLKKQGNQCSLDQPLHIDEHGNALTAKDVLPAPEIVDERRLVQEETLLTVLALLIIWRDGKFAEPLYRIIALGETQRDTSTAMGFSQSYLSRIEKKFKTFCKQYHAHEESPTMRPLCKKVEQLRPKILDLLHGGSAFPEVATTLLQPKEETPVPPKPSASSRSCSVEGCGRPHQARGYCHKHYISVWKKEKKQGIKEEAPVTDISIAKEAVQKAIQRATETPEIPLPQVGKNPTPPQDFMDLVLTIQRQKVSADSVITQLKQLESVLHLFYAHEFDISIQIRRVGDLEKEE